MRGRQCLIETIQIYTDTIDFYNRSTNNEAFCAIQ